MKRLALAAGATVLLLLLVSAVSRVGPNERAVLDPRFGDPVVLEPGIHFRTPLFSRLSRYPLSPRKVESEVRVETRDNLNFRIRYTLEETFDPETLLAFHARRAGRPLPLVLKQLADESVQEAAPFLRADEILGTALRERWLGVLYPPTKDRGLKALGIEVAAPDPKVFVNAALIYQQRNLPAAALRLARLGLERAPNSSRAHYGLGRIHELQGKQKEAEDEYVRALFLEPAAREPMGRLVGALLKRREFERARRLLQAALDKDGSSSPHFNWLGVTLQLEAKYDEALRAFDQAVALDPKNPEYHANRGALLLAKGDARGAQESLREALKIQPNHTLALYNLGVALALEGKPAEALPFLERAEQSGSPTVGLLNALARVYQETGQSAKAVLALQRSLKMQPEQPEQLKALRQLQLGRPAPGAPRGR